MMMRGREKGFTLLELLLVVAVIGILFVIAIPNFLNALDRGRQKRTLSDIRTIGVAVESYAVDANIYPRNFSEASVESTVQGVIQPTFIKDTPLVDGWGYVMTYASNSSGSQYTILSVGKDGVVDTTNGGPTLNFDCDIQFGNGAFVQWPDGIQT